MLSLVLTRPRLRWVERLTETSPGIRLWAERSLTLLAFAIGGYAWVTLFLTLHGELEAGPARLVRGAAYILIAYAGLTHFEPFANGRTRNLLAAFVAYVGWMFFAAGVGAASALDVRLSSISAGWDILRVATTAAAACFAMWWLIPKLEGAIDRTFDSLIERYAESNRPPDTFGRDDAGEITGHVSALTRILALPVTISILMRAVHRARRRRRATDSR